MESDWRFNIALAGMSGTDWTLAARGSGPNPLNLYLVERETTPKRKWVYSVNPGSLPFLWDSSLWIPADGSFPWGEDVEPD